MKDARSSVARDGRHAPELVARGSVHGSKHGETSMVGEGGGMHSAEQVSKGLAGNIQTNVRWELDGLLNYSPVAPALGA